jgi:hypothetical protein
LLGLQVNATKFVNLTISDINLEKFNVTTDNIGVKKDEASILYKLQGVISVIEATINSVLSALHIRLPELQTIDYQVAFDYQDGALGTGMKVASKVI